MTELTLIGAPTDVGASVLGASMGPDALRIAGIARALQGLGLAVQDLGNLSGPGNPQAAPQGGFRHLVEVTRWNEAVFAATLSYLGMVVAVTLLIAISATGSHEFSWKETAISIVVLLVMSDLVFVRGLELQFPVWPKFLAH